MRPTVSPPVRKEAGHSDSKYREVPQKHENWDSSLSRIGLALTHVCRFFLVAQQVSFWENETNDHRARSTGLRRESHVCFRGSAPRCQRIRGVAEWPRPKVPPEPRCRICRNDQVRTKVNDLLATGASYAMVLRALGDDNAKLEKRDRVTIDSIRNHTARHFPGSAGRPRHLPGDPGAPGKENGVDSSTAWPPRSPHWPFMKPSWSTGTRRSSRSRRRTVTATPANAAEKFNGSARKDEGARDLAPMRAEMGCIIEVVRTFIPCRTVAGGAGGPARRSPNIHSSHCRRLKGCAWCPSTTPRTRTTPDGH